ncbi:hypothetical protein CAPTEDRAFT_136114 [Capitella teleta]|uniref:Cytochrome P450 n=1 Tax=Capitella teleta TaxID=283909 RepID=R7TMR1_CAPTE|nr:hypothetical protein CAPTEDRAFT_136114 [Capitella teleta]|eukprot:ELT92836.1 hypothetical protein CAPTEDRAFT_136114 [Capitella teleta]
MFTLSNRAGETSPPLGCPFHEPTSATQSDNEASTAQTGHHKSYADMPGPKGLPGIGNALAYSRFGNHKFEKILDSRLSYMRKYGKVYREKLGHMEMVHIFDPSDIATMFREEGDHPSRGKIAHVELTYLKRSKKFISFAYIDGAEWARQRAAIQRLMMHPTAATRYINWQTPVAQDFVQYIDENRNEEGIIPNLYEDLFKYTMESIAAVCFGDRIGVFDKNPESMKDADILSNSITENNKVFRNCMFSFPWYQYFRTPLYKRYEKVADQMKAWVKLGEKIQLILIYDFYNRIMGKHVDRCSNKIEARGLRTGPDVVNPFGGVFEPNIEIEDRSTGNSLAFFLYNLAANPEKQEVLYREIENVLPNKQQPTAKTFKNMPYLKAALKESFRLNFPVYGGSGRVMPQDTVFGNYVVPKGVFIFANIAAMGRMEEHFPEPAKYHPERWLRGENASMGATWKEDSGFLSLPFSHGLRACPGKRYAEQGLYLAAIAILQNFKLSYDKPEPVEMLHLPFTIPDRPLDITFTQRTSC